MSTYVMHLEINTAENWQADRHWEQNYAATSHANKKMKEKMSTDYFPDWVDGSEVL